MKKSLSVLLSAAMLLLIISGCAGNPIESSEKGTQVFTDSCGRDVELPKEITRVAPSGSVATMILATIAPEALVCISSTPSSSQYKYLPENLLTLPTVGQLYGSKSTINYESLIDAAPQVIIDLGDLKENMAGDLDALQKKTGIPVIFIEADLDSMEAAYRSLGQLLGRVDRCTEIADFIGETMTMAAQNSVKIADEDKISVMFTSGSSGLNTNARGSVQATVIDIVGAVNAVVVEEISNKGGGNTINMEQLYIFDPDCIIMSTGGPFETLSTDPAWTNLSAVKNGAYYEIPGQPYNWMSNPPSMNMVLGIWWLGNLLYPALYDYNMTEVAQRIFDLFWDYDLSDEEAAQLLLNSTLKRDAAQRGPQ